MWKVADPEWLLSQTVKPGWNTYASNLAYRITNASLSATLVGENQVDVVCSDHRVFSIWTVECGFVVRQMSSRDLKFFRTWCALVRMLGVLRDGGDLSGPRNVCKTCLMERGACLAHPREFFEDE